MGCSDAEVAGERDMLGASLDAARHAVVSRLVGVPVVLLLEPLVSPDSSLLGVIKHLTLLERGWFAYTFAGLDVGPVDTDSQGNVGWRLDHADTAGTVVGQYRSECQRAARSSSVPVWMKWHPGGRPTGAWSCCGG